MFGVRELVLKQGKPIEVWRGCGAEKKCYTNIIIMQPFRSSCECVTCTPISISWEENVLHFWLSAIHSSPEGVAMFACVWRSSWFVLWFSLLIVWVRKQKVEETRRYTRGEGKNSLHSVHVISTCRKKGKKQPTTARSLSSLLQTCLEVSANTLENYNIF